MSRKNWRTAPAAQRILAKLASGWTGTRDELAAAVHCHPVTAGEHIRAMHADGAIHVTAWRRAVRGHPAPIWTHGPGEDARQLSPLTRAQISRRYRDKLLSDVGRELGLQILRAKTRGRSAVVVQGVEVWRRGQGTDREAAARVAGFGAE